MDSPNGPHKKHKKHKKHKHKRKHQADDEDSGAEINVTDDIFDTPKPAIKLKIKIGGQTLGTKSSSLPTPSVDWNVPLFEPVDGSSANIFSDLTDETFPTLPVESDPEPEKPVIKAEASDEEQEWLDALEAGKLDDNGDIVKKKDPSLLTARQRALLHGDRNDALQQLPSGYKAPELTEEQLQRRLQRAKKRREQAQEKREKDKKQTLERLLKKQEGKGKGAKKSCRKSVVPMFSYHLSAHHAHLSVPQGFTFPMPPQKSAPPPPKAKCGVADCRNLKKYACSKTGIPLCSLVCYKKNLQSRSLL